MMRIQSSLRFLKIQILHRDYCESDYATKPSFTISIIVGFNNFKHCHCGHFSLFSDHSQLPIAATSTFAVTTMNSANSVRYTFR